MSNLENRIIQYVQKLPPAVQGEGGQTVLFSAASKLVEGFDLTAEQVTGFLWDYYNPRCVPPWNDGNTADFIHQCEAAWKKAPAERGRLLKPGERLQAVKAPAFSLARLQTAKHSGGGRSGSKGAEILIPHDDGPERWYEEKRGKMVFRYERIGSDVYQQTNIPADSELQRVYLFDYRDGFDGPYQIMKRLEMKKRKADGKPEKSFTAYHWDQAAGGFLRGSGGLPRIPFRLADLKEVETVFLVEGEKKAFHLNRFLERRFDEAEILTTCFPDGASAWNDDRRNFFRGKDVFVWPDNDETGKQYARNICDSLEGMARSVRTLKEYPPGFRPHDDAVEVIQYFGNQKEKGNETN